jgi:hypothetical protein
MLRLSVEASTDKRKNNGFWFLKQAFFLLDDGTRLPKNVVDIH